jgi:hypothetical protein
MPNYTRNELIIYGSSEQLKYLYERNRVSEEDAKYMKHSIVSELSFEKCVPRAITKVIESYIEEKYTGTKTKDSIPEHFQKWDLLCTIWGTKWDACDSMVDLDEINNENEPHIKYLFNTAWNYPYNWLITISQIFPKLKFRIKYSNEGDGYDFTYIDEFKDGIETKIEKYSAVNRCIDENGNVNNIAQIIIEYCIAENVMITEYHRKSKKTEDWLTYCKNFVEENKKKENYENELFHKITYQIADFIYEKQLHPSLYINNELCNIFAEKVKHM